MSAARANKQEVTPLYLNSGLSGDAATELAQQLYVVLNSRLPVRVNVLSDRAEGSLVNPLKPDEDIIGTINTARGPLELIVERIDNGSGMPAIRTNQSKSRMPPMRGCARNCGSRPSTVTRSISL